MRKLDGSLCTCYARNVRRSVYKGRLGSLPLIWRQGSFYEEFFICLLTRVKTCDKMTKAQTLFDCCGDADAAAEAPPRLTFRHTSPGSMCSQMSAGEYYLREKEGGDLVENAFPRCRKCSEGDLVPLSDFGSQGASIEYKAWVCTNPSCLYNIKIRNGDIIINEPISDGSLHSYRSNRQ